MICLTCKTGTPAAGFATVTLERDGAIIVFKNVPAQICDNCEEQYVDSATTKRLMVQAQTAIANGAELEVVRLQAA